MPITINGDGTITGISAGGLPNDSVTLANMAHGTDGQILTYDASGAPVALGPGSDGQVLTSTGAGSPPAFEAVATAEMAVTSETAWTTLGTGNDVTISGIAAGAKRLTLLVRAQSFTGSNELEIELGDAGGIETSAYVHCSWHIGNDRAGTQPVTDCFQTYGINSTTLTMGHRYDFWRWDDGTHMWMIEGITHYESGTNALMFGMNGFKTLSAELTQIRLGGHASDTFDSGEYKLFTWT